VQKNRTFTCFNSDKSTTIHSITGVGMRVPIGIHTATDTGEPAAAKQGLRSTAVRSRQVNARRARPSSTNVGRLDLHATQARAWVTNQKRATFSNLQVRRCTSMHHGRTPAMRGGAARRRAHTCSWPNDSVKKRKKGSAFRQPRRTGERPGHIGGTGELPRMST
jgi:hypothetical protein